MVARVRLSGRSNRGQRPLTIIDAVNDPSLFKPFFKNQNSWATWFAILAAIFALPMTEEQLRLYQQVTGRTEQPDKIAKEVWLVIGRRGGKSRIISLIATWLACFHDYKPYLAPGEKGVVMVTCVDRRQSKVVLRYIKAFLNQVPMLAEMIENETAESISLTNHIEIQINAANFRNVRGFSCVAILLDEIAYFRTDEESANPDSEIIAAIRPAMSTIPNAMLLAASSPYAKRGMLYESHKNHFGKDGDPILVVQADTATVNPVVDPKVIADAYEADPASAAAEYGALFRSNIEGYVAREVVDACIARGIFEREPRYGLKYFGFVDPSGGSADSFTLAIGHRDADSLILDAIREVRPPFSPESVCAEFAGLLRSYRITKVTGDRFAGLWPVEQFAKVGIRYEQSARPKSDLYRDLLPLLNSRRVELLDNQRLVNQLVSLERRTSRGGRDTIDHPPSSHDDVANCVAGVLTAIAAPVQKLRMVIGIQDYAPRNGSSGAGYEVDPKTLRRLNPDPYMLGSEANRCIPGRGLDAHATLFNAQRGITNLRRYQ